MFEAITFKPIHGYSSILEYPAQIVRKKLGFVLYGKLLETEILYATHKLIQEVHFTVSRSKEHSWKVYKWSLSLTRLISCNNCKIICHYFRSKIFLISSQPMQHIHSHSPLPRNLEHNGNTLIHLQPCAHACTCGRPHTRRKRERERSREKERENYYRSEVQST